MNNRSEHGRKRDPQLVAERERQVVELSLAGFSTDTIAGRVGVHPRTVKRIRARALARSAEAWDDSALDQFRDLALARLERVIRSAWADMSRGDSRAARVVMDAIHRQTRLLGVEPPRRAEIAVRSELDAEIEQLIEQMRQADLLPDPDGVPGE